jgi:hypothetical protein
MALVDRIILNHKDQTDLIKIKHHKIQAHKITIIGEGFLESCRIHFCKKGKDIAGSPSIYFTLDIGSFSNSLFPQGIKNPIISGFDFCVFQSLPATISDSDIITLIFTPAVDLGFLPEQQ